jgi:hypothetical protein
VSGYGLDEDFLRRVRRNGGTEPLSLPSAATGGAPRIPEDLGGPSLEELLAQVAQSSAPKPPSQRGMSPGELEAAELRAAQERGSFNSMLNRAGAGFDASARIIANIDGPGTVRERPELRDAPVQELQARRASQAQGAQKDRASRMADPSSPESREAQRLVLAAFPSLDRALVESASADSLSKFSPQLGQAATRGLRASELEQGERRLDIQAQAEQRKAGAEQRALDLRAEELAARMGLEYSKLSLDRQRLFQEVASEQAKAERAANKDDKGQTIPAGEAAIIGQSSTAIRALDTLGKQFDEKAGGLYGQVTGMLPGTDATQYDDDVLATAQAVGTILEGGKLAAGDEVKYRKMLPARGDSPERAKNKLANVKRLVEDATREKVRALGAAGYNTKGFEAPVQSAQPQRTPAPTDAKGQMSLDSAPPPPEGKVRVRIGNKVGLIPRSALEAAKARGAVEVP